MTRPPAVSDPQAPVPQARVADRRLTFRLEYATIAWNVLEGVFAVTAGLLAGSLASTRSGTVPRAKFIHP